MRTLVGVRFLGRRTRQRADLGNPVYGVEFACLTAVWLDFNPCSKAPGWPRGRWASRRQFIVEGVPAQLSAAANMARTNARSTAAAGGTGQHCATSAPRIRRDFSLREGSALEPQRLSRRRFPLGTPFRVARRRETEPAPRLRGSRHCARNDGQTATATRSAGEPGRRCRIHASTRSRW